MARVREFYNVGALDGEVFKCEEVILLCEVDWKYSGTVKKLYFYHNDKIMATDTNGDLLKIKSIREENSGIYTCVPETIYGRGQNKTLTLKVKS